MKNYKGSYTMRRDAYWKAYYPSLKFYHSIIGVIKYFFIVLTVVLYIVGLFFYSNFDVPTAIGIDAIIVYLISGLSTALLVFIVHMFFTLQEEMIRLKVDRNFMLYEIDQKTLKQE